MIKAGEDVLRVKDLHVVFQTEEGLLTAAAGVNLVVKAGEVMSVVGESGCGKSVLAETILRLIPEPPGRITRGEINFNSSQFGWLDLARQDRKGGRMRAIRGNEISMIFQEPMTSLNPVYTVGNQIIEAICLHQNLSPRDARTLAIDMLREANIPLPEQRVDEYPHHMSGGMRQRVMIAMALACQPQILIADEPTTAL
ncbi:MAG: ABC transporter ATP-binding protein, partial [Kiritimatiellota bacterium]|nr:ABC transporter ATP-binding protein [Kiritimatiellota bacterium]